MKLPHADQAAVASSKILKYLLDETHPKGKDKAIFFMRFGFTREDWEGLEAALLGHAAQHEVASRLETPEGVHYAVEGELQTPDNRNPQLRSIWAIDKGSDTPRFITAYPLKKNSESI